ncbi:MAG: papain-like cysteine protease family protein, partial [Acidobacteriota bacterium]
TPIVNIQNAPSTPAPGAGLAAATELLGKSGVFKDITGLDQNQKNAMQTYLSNQENAKAFGEMAKEIFMMGHNTDHSDKIADSIRNSPELSKEEKADLLKDHFGQMVDGGQTKKAEQEKAKDSKPTLTEAAIKAADEGKLVKATSADGSGKAESVEIGTGSTNKYRVAGKAVRLVLQGDKDAACWAAAATMMKGWKDGTPYTISQVLAMVGPEYLAKYNNNQALLASEKMDFVDALGMVGESPASYPFETYLAWMKSYGPLWVTVDSDTSTDIAAHAKILIGYNGDGTEANSRLVFLDPSKEGEQSETFAEFLEEFEQTARDNPGQLFTQVVHFKDAIAGEGNAVSAAMISYRPALSSTMVINKIEFETVSNLLNWSDASVDHNRTDNGTRAASQLIHLVLHETASPVASEATAHGFNGPKNETSHMTVMRNATVLQFNDLRQLENHIIGLNSSSIGIEFVNRGWLASPKGPAADHPDTPANLYSYEHEAVPVNRADLTAQHLARFPEGNDYLYCFWGSGFNNIYRIPPDIAQLEKDVELVQWLTTDLKTKLDALEDQLNFTPAEERSDLIKGSVNAQLAADKVNTIIASWQASELHKLFFEIERTWLQLVSYDDVSGIWAFPAANVPALPDQGSKNLFVFTRGWDYLDPANIAGKSGIISHNAAGHHSDGSFLALYTWLRIEKAFDSAKSYRLTKSLMKDHFFKASLKTNPNDRKIILLNVEDANLV